MKAIIAWMGGQISSCGLFIVDTEAEKMAIHCPKTLSTNYTMPDVTQPDLMEFNSPDQMDSIIKAEWQAALI